MSEHPRGVTGTAVDGQLPSAEQARDLEALQPWTPPRAPREHPASHGEKGNTGGHPGTRMASPSAWGASILAPGTERAPSGLPGAAWEGGVLEGGVSFLNSYFGAFVVASKNGRFFAALTRGLCLLACCAWSWGPRTEGRWLLGPQPHTLAAVCTSESSELTWSASGRVVVVSVPPEFCEVSERKHLPSKVRLPASYLTLYCAEEQGAAPAFAPSDTLPPAMSPSPRPSERVLTKASHGGFFSLLLLRGWP